MLNKSMGENRDFLSRLVYLKKNRYVCFDHLCLITGSSVNDLVFSNPFSFARNHSLKIGQNGRKIGTIKPKRITYQVCYEYLSFISCAKVALPAFVICKKMSRNASTNLLI